MVQVGHMKSTCFESLCSTVLFSPFFKRISTIVCSVGVLLRLLTVMLRPSGYELLCSDFTITKTYQNVFCHEICLSFVFPDCAILMLESSAQWWHFFLPWMALVVSGQRTAIWCTSKGLVGGEMGKLAKPDIHYDK